MNASAQNMEEAANIASEFIYSVDNLPQEVAHLLAEIKHKETRANELQQEIDKDSARYIRHSIRASAASTPSPSSRAPSPKSMLLPAKISESYAQIDNLISEKCILAQRLIDLISMTRARLDADLAKVRILQGDVVETLSSYSPGPGPGTPADSYATLGRNPTLQITESLRNALATPSKAELRRSPGTPALASSASIGPSATKRRRLAASASIKLIPAASPTKHRSASPTTNALMAEKSYSHPRSRLSRQIHPKEDPEPEMEVDEDEDEDAEGEDADGEDERLYCFCQKQSYGDMIACDNENGCPYEWFHLNCVGLKQPMPEKWYCSVCKAKAKKTIMYTTCITRASSIKYQNCNAWLFRRLKW
ncbi:hypothetical protein BD779DRAFT_1485362 [Infundibulicybe gibba]|nr:hypothetical protein BD779DRAFT_1485362 [Infundibulicybe gibba]